MKNLFCLLIFCAVALASHAQIVNTVTLSKTTLTAPDNATGVLYIDKTVQSVEVQLSKTSGTVAGTVTLQGSVDGTNYDVLNTLTLADQALNRKTMALPVPLIYAHYKIVFATTGTSVSTVAAWTVRRN